MNEEWLLLGRLFDAARQRMRGEARRLANAILASSTDDAIRAIANAYLEGGRTAFLAYGQDLQYRRTIPREVATLWATQSQALGARLVERLFTTVDARKNVTSMFIENYAELTVQQSLWRGVDQTGQELGTLAAVEWKTWVRSFPRKEQRDWHDMLEGVAIPVDDKFRLPGGPNVGMKVYGPRDWDSVSDPGEHMSCGHALRFSKTLTREQAETTRRRGRSVYEAPRIQAR